ncbi:MAG: hypothetical protein R3348_09225, partial [Xanthomonadales bacterium]|nr:hypothetical protein [Xanthomonadales bacterium]
DGNGNQSGHVRAYEVIPPEVLVGALSDFILDLLESDALSQGITNALIAILDAALSAINADNFAAACGQLTGFVQIVEAGSGNTIASEDAVAMLAPAEAAQAALRCD